VYYFTGKFNAFVFVVFNTDKYKYILTTMTDTLAIDYINQLRIDPTSLVHRFNTISKALSRARRKVQSKELSDITNKLETMKPLPILEKSVGLNAMAEDMVKKMIFLNNENYVFSDIEVNDLLKKHLSSYKKVTHLITIGELENITVRILISERDPKREYKEAVFSESCKYIGAFSRQFDEEDDLTVIILAEDVEELEEDNEYPELKEMFKTLDQNNTGYLIPDVIYDSLISLQYDVKNQTFVEIFNTLRKTHPNGVDYPTFKATVLTFHVKPIKSKKDWRRVFNLFVDDALHDTISINNIKRIALFLNEEISIPDLKKYMKWASDNGSELNFEEFYDVMTVQLDN
jgi:Ca2+-binding EF-hand superfamily protein